MRRLRQGLLLVFFFLAFLLHCTQLCLAAGHGHRTTFSVASPRRSSEHTPCHFPSVPPQRVPDKCPDCRDHFFLRAAPSGPATLTVSGPLSSLFCWLTQPHHSLLTQRAAGVLWLDKTAVPPPRYLTLAVLRLYQSGEADPSAQI